MKLQCVIKLTTIFWIVSTLSVIDAARILGLFPYNGKSHFDFFHPLFIALAEKGHDVTIVSHFPNKKPIANYTDLPLDGLPVLKSVIDLKEVELGHNLLREIKFPFFLFMDYKDMQACEVAFESKAIKQVLKDPKKFDVILVESFVSDCMHGIAYMLKAPVISLTSHALMPWHFNRMGSPVIESFMPNTFLGHSNEMGFLQRLNNVIHQRMFVLMHELITQRSTNNMIRKYYGDSIPPIQDLVRNTSLMLINQHFSLNGPTPYVPGIIEVGGLHIKEAKPLDPELKSVLDNAKSGVIYFSWGSMVRPETIPEEKKQALIKVLSQFDQLVVIKWPKTAIPNPPKNFYVREWMPQRDILCHPNVKVFMTHGGLLGTTEACHCGVAIVVTPFFGDQFLNAAAVEARNAGVMLPLRDLQEENILKAIRTALSPIVQENAKVISDAFNNRPVPPLKLAIWWVEHTIRTKGLPLGVNASSQMNWFTYNNVDVYGFLLMTLLLSVIGLWVMIRKLCYRSQKLKTH